MTILYDHQAFSDQDFGGISRYYSELIHGIDNADSYEANLMVWRSNNEYIRSYRPLVKPFLQEYYIPKKRPALNLLNKYYSFFKINKEFFDIYHPTNYHPYLLNYIKGRPVVVTFHDMIHEILGRNNELIKDRWKVEHKKQMALRSNKIIAISESTKQDIIDILDVPEDKIKVIYHGCSIPVQKNIETTSSRVKKDYLLYVGARRHYKNFKLFLSAVSPVLRMYDINLICAGGGQFMQDEINIIQSLNLESFIHQVPIDDNSLIKLYREAIAFVFPSLYEGFGLPVLEAFACGCPCILSNVSSLPEIGGDAATYFNPNYKDSIQAGISKLLDDSNLRKSMKESGYSRLKQFSWKETVQKTTEVYSSLI